MIKILTFLILSISFSRGRNVPLDQRFQWCSESKKNSCSVVDYSSTTISRYILKNDLNHLLQEAFNQLVGVGFKFIGYDADFFHGHYIYNENFQGILYHTQELASMYQKVSMDHKFAYLDKDKRNWLQNFQEEIIHNGFDYISIDGQSSKRYKGFRENYTVTTAMLDVFKLTGSSDKLNSLQFTFYKTHCPQSVNLENNIIKILDVDENPICMIVH